MANVPSLSVVRDQARPKKIGRYELEESLGSEGGRETYRARVRGLAGFDRIFAVKCVRRRPGVALSRTDPFITVAKRTAIVTDARVVRVLDADVIDGVGIVVTEFIHGLDLERFREWAQVSGELATGGDDAAKRWQKLVAYLGSEIAGALAAMHALAPPLVHGGLSPRNVIVSTRGSIKVLDVGLGTAALKGGDALSQRALAYAAPNSPGVEPTAPSDVRALGAMLFELATGELPAPGITSAGAGRMLETLWPAMAEFVASMLAEDPALRPRAAKAAEVLASHWADIPDASMVSEMASLVRNFSAFVADASPPNGQPTPAIDSSPADKIPPASSGILSMPPPAPPVSSASFLVTSDQATRVSPDGGYASALFRALPAEAPAPKIPVQPIAPAPPTPLRQTGAPAVGRSPTLRSFSAPKPAELSPAKLLDQRFAPFEKKSAPLVMAAAPPSEEKLMPAMPAMPAMRAMPAKPAIPAKPAMPARPAMPTISQPPVVSPPQLSVRSSLLAPATGSIPALSSLEAAEPSVEPDTMAEAADWGAQALAALGTQAGVQIKLLSPNQDEDASDETMTAPPSVSDPGIEEAFAFSPIPPSAVQWPAAPSSAQAMTVPQFQEPDSPARAELLEDNLMEDEQTPLLVPTGGGRPPFPEPDSLPDETLEQQELDPEPAFAGRPALEATAFATEEEAEPEPEPEPEPEVLRVAQEMTSPDAYPTRQPASRSAVRSRPSEADDDLGNEPWQAPRSRAKKIAAVLVVAAGLGAGAAALMIGLGKKTAPSSMTLPQPRSKKAAMPQPSTAASAMPAGSAGKAAPSTASATAGGKAAAPPVVPVDKATAAKGQQDTRQAVSAKATPAPAVAVAATAPASSGGAVRLHITSQPQGARVWINGEERGDTPCVVEVKSGSARLALVHAGYLTSQSTIEVREGTKIDETLKPVEPPMTGEARFRAECKTTGKLPVVVDGKETGILCPFTKMRVEPGTHTIGLLVPATGKVHQKEVTLSAGVRSVVFAD